MKFEECKVGDIVTPKTNEIKTRDIAANVISYTTSTKKFMITGLHYYTKTVNIIPINSETTDALTTFVEPSCLDVYDFSMPAALHRKPITRPQTPDYKLDFEVRREKNELSAYYHGIKLATVRCHPDDTYDEEFGLHLLLRRACLKLKDEHTVVETVEELLQKP